MEIKLGRGGKVVSFFLVIIGTLILSVLAAGLENSFWASPLIGLALMFFLGNFPNQNQADVFEWAYFLLILGSGALLVFTSEQAYWTTPILLGVLYNLFIGELRITSG